MNLNENRYRIQTFYLKLLTKFLIIEGFGFYLNDTFNLLSLLSNIEISIVESLLIILFKVIIKYIHCYIKINKREGFYLMNLISN